MGHIGMAVSVRNPNYLILTVITKDRKNREREREREIIYTHKYTYTFTHMQVRLKREIRNYPNIGNRGSHIEG